MARIHSRFHIASAFALFAVGLCTAQAQVPRNTSPVTVDGGTQLPPRGTPMFSDSFEYDASRSSNPMTIFSQHGYYSTKATNAVGSNPGGYLFTRPDTARGSRVLVMESRPTEVPRMDGWSYGQTDYYLQLGAEGQPDVVPANAWIQFWGIRHGGQRHRSGRQGAVRVPCFVSVPSPNWSWMLIWGRIANAARDDRS